LKVRGKQEPDPRLREPKKKCEELARSWCACKTGIIRHRQASHRELRKHVAILEQEIAELKAQ